MPPDFDRLRKRLREGSPALVCAVCRKPFQRKTNNLKAQVTCSPHCSFVYAKCRYYFNPESHDRMIRRNARNVLANPEKHSPKTVARAKAVLEGAPVKRVVRGEVYALLESVGRLDLLPPSDS